MESLTFLLFLFVGLHIAQATLPDVNRNVTQMITARGYPCEEHSATTEDGFVLSIQRIPHGKNNNTKQSQKKVVFLLHGFLDASTTWVINGDVESLAFILADAGFDVWLGNTRGNIYSRNNLNYNVDQDEYWDWSFDQMAKYDLPAFYSYILSSTGASQLVHIGHSQGTCQAFAAYSAYPEVMKSVELFVALAPVAFLSNSQSLILDYGSKLSDWFLYDLFGTKGFPPVDNIAAWLETFFPVVCANFPAACESLIFFAAGCNNAGQCDPGNLNQTRIPVYSAHLGGANVMELVHFFQLARAPVFNWYDYGEEGNKKHYNSTTPPQYDLTKVTLPVAIFSGGEDNFADPTDVQQLTKLLPNIVLQHYEAEYEHLDFVWGVDAYKKIYPLVVKLIASLK